MKLFVKVKYDGTRYAGYQVQNNARTIQETLNRAVADLFGFECDVTGCSRTDAGVHALCFCATIQKQGEKSLLTKIPCEKIPYAINFRLPDDISVYYADWVNEEFHARYSVKSKTYEYHIFNGAFKDPFNTNRAYHFPKLLSCSDIERMNDAAKQICGKKDFSSFMASGSNVCSTIRNVFDCGVEKVGDMVVIRISADGFLYNMVRIISGTLLEVGKRNIDPDQISSIIESHDRSLAGPTLPAHGLYLTEVNY
jgi:tRNA pseudouridine38-40 synthase